MNLSTHPAGKVNCGICCYVIYIGRSDSRSNPIVLAFGSASFCFHVATDKQKTVRPSHPRTSFRFIIGRQKRTSCRTLPASRGILNITLFSGIRYAVADSTLESCINLPSKYKNLIYNKKITTTDIALLTIYNIIAYRCPNFIF